MVSRERLLHLARSAERLATARRVRVVAQLLLAAAFVFVLVRLRSIWNDSHVDLGSVDWTALVGASLLAVLGTVTTAFAWLAMLRQLIGFFRVRWIGIFFQAQLAKYIPGTVWQYAGRTALARTQGVPVGKVALSLALELGVSAATGGVVSALLLGWWGGLGVVLLLVAGGSVLVSSGSRGLTRPAARACAAGALGYVGVWVTVGLGFWLTARGLTGAAASEIPRYVGSFAVAWLAGLAALYAPGGIGVREAVLVVLLRGRLGTADALTLAAVSRAIALFADAAVGLIGVTLLRGAPAPGKEPLAVRPSRFGARS